MRSIAKLMNAFSTALAYLSGASFLLLAFYVTWDVIARKTGALPYSGVSDEISGYTLAVAGTWGMAHALTNGSHVRIEVLIEYFPPMLRRILLGWAILTMGAFAALLAYYSWRLSAGSAAISARSISVLRAPIAVPQAMMAFGFTLLAVQSAISLIAMIVLPPGADRADETSDTPTLHQI